MSIPTARDIPVLDENEPDEALKYFKPRRSRADVYDAPRCDVVIPDGSDVPDQAALRPARVVVPVRRGGTLLF